MPPKNLYEGHVLLETGRYRWPVMLSLGMFWSASQARNFKYALGLVQDSLYAEIKKFDPKILCPTLNFQYEQVCGIYDHFGNLRVRLVPVPPVAECIEMIKQEFYNSYQLGPQPVRRRRAYRRVSESVMNL